MEIKTKYNVGDIVYHVSDCTLEAINREPRNNKSKWFGKYDLKELVIETITIGEHGICYIVHPIDCDPTDCYCCHSEYAEKTLFSTRAEVIAIIEETHKQALYDLLHEIKDIIKENGYE